MTTISPHGIGKANYHPSDTVPTAPPPPSEVKIRTMRSDLESMAKSGGGLPRFQNVKVSGLAAQVQPQTPAINNPNAAPAPAPTELPATKKSSIMPVIITLVIVVLLGVLAWFAYSIFILHKPALNTSTTNPTAQTAPSSQNTSAETNSVLAPTTTPTTAPTTPPATPLSFTHVSLFKIPADQVLTISFSSGVAQSAADLESYSQKITSLVATAKKTATLIEIDAQNTQSQAASMNDLLTEANASILSPTVLAADFNPDATFFVYRDKNGVWPGYILSLASGKNWSSVSGDAKSIESSGSIANLFLTNVGTQSTTGFTNITISGSSARTVAFTGGSVPASFVYGWMTDHQYFIISTSQDGYAVALKRLE